MAEIKLGDALVFFPTGELQGALAGLIDIGYGGITVDPMYRRVFNVVLSPTVATVLLNNTAYQFALNVELVRHFVAGAKQVYEILKLKNNFRIFDGLKERVQLPNLPFDVLNVIASHASASTQMKLKTYAKTTNSAEADKYEKWFKNDDYYSALIAAVTEGQVNIVKYILPRYHPPSAATQWYHEYTTVDRNFIQKDLYHTIENPKKDEMSEASVVAILNSLKYGDEIPNLLSNRINGDWSNMMKVASFIGNRRLLEVYRDKFLQREKQQEMYPYHTTAVGAAILYFMALGGHNALFAPILESFYKNYKKTNGMVGILIDISRAAVEGGSLAMLEFLRVFMQERNIPFSPHSYIPYIKTRKVAEWFYQLPLVLTSEKLGILEKLLKYGEREKSAALYELIKSYGYIDDYKTLLILSAIKGNNMEMLQIFMNSFIITYVDTVRVCREAVKSDDADIIQFIFSVGYMSQLDDQDKNTLFKDVKTVETAKLLISNGLRPDYVALLYSTRYLELFKFYWIHYRNVFAESGTVEFVDMTVDTLKYIMGENAKDDSGDLEAFVLNCTSLDIDYLEYVWSLPETPLISALKTKLEPIEGKAIYYSAKLSEENEVMKYVKMLNYKNRLARLSL